MASTKQWTYYYLIVQTVHLTIAYLTQIIKTKPNAKIKAIKGDAEQSKSAFTFNKSVDDKVVSDFNKGLDKLKENGKLAEIGKKWFGENVSEPKQSTTTRT